MPLLLILVSLLFTACKKDNHLSGVPQAPIPKDEKVLDFEVDEKGDEKGDEKIQVKDDEIVFEKKSFITISHLENKSPLRKKLLNHIVATKFPIDKSHLEIKKNDELGGYEMSERDLNLYSEKEKLMAKVVVSSSDRVEIFFIPSNIQLNHVISLLDLRAESERVLKWVSDKETKTSSGKSFYLVNLNYNDLIKNDQDYFHETIDLRKDVQNKSISLMDNSKVEIEIYYETYQQIMGVQQYNGESIKCNRDLLEAGMCGPCTFKRNIPVNSFEKVQINNIDQLGSFFRIDGKDYLPSSLNPQVLASGERFKIALNLSDYAVHRKFTLDLIQNPMSPTPKTVSGFDFSQACRSQDTNVGIGLSKRADISMKVKIFGRGEALRKIVL